MIFWSFGLALLMTACGGGKGKQQVEWEDLLGESIRDSTIYGICMEGTAMNTLQLLTDNGDTLVLSLVNTKEHGGLFGGMGVGDRMAVLVNKDSTEATMVLNQTSLMGEWVMPNPMDGSSEMGIYIKDGGIAESINMGTIIYESWRMYNGMLEIRSTRDDGGNFQETVKYKLISLTNDSLIIKDSEETFEYCHPHHDDSYDNLDLELDEDEEFEDFVM